MASSRHKRGMDFSKPLVLMVHSNHFGTGPMEPVLAVGPGENTLRAVMADDKHPRRRLRRTDRYHGHGHVQGRQPPSEGHGRPGVAMLERATGASARPPFGIAVHVSGMSVTNAASSEPVSFRVQN
jgi:hypothetical protein